MKKTILIVVEDVDLNRSTKRWLEKTGEMEIAADSVFDRPGALAALRNDSERFDLVIAELDEEDTFEFFAGMIRQINPKLKILLYADDDRSESQRAFVDAIVFKSEEESARLLRQTVIRLLTS